jgi:parallel beta-helix repeat protein
MRNSLFAKTAFAVQAAAVFTFTFSGFSQGLLTPPGAPGPTMKTLAQIEPRTPISSPVTITNPGSYYLTTNLTVPAFGSAITINAENVTLDLNGYTLSGVPNSFGAIIIASNHAAVVNGFIRNCAFNYAVDAGSVSGCRLENLILSGNSSGINAGSEAIVRNCVAINDVGPGITCLNDTYIANNLCASNGNGGIYLVGSGNRIDNNQLFYNNTAGIVGANVDASNNLVINNSFKGGALIIGAPGNWIVGTSVNKASIATNTRPCVNFDMN